mmetsp:Transcript_57382/g.186400  ORF Transcript_57382/g.186400 Transcript_57382/m.186400 type:complete len:244 (-) Transcript_57382:169-900(-)
MQNAPSITERCRSSASRPLSSTAARRPRECPRGRGCCRPDLLPVCVLRVLNLDALCGPHRFLRLLLVILRRAPSPQAARGRGGGGGGRVDLPREVRGPAAGFEHRRGHVLEALRFGVPFRRLSGAQSSGDLPLAPRPCRREAGVAHGFSEHLDALAQGDIASVLDGHLSSAPRRGGHGLRQRAAASAEAHGQQGAVLGHRVAAAHGPPVLHDPHGRREGDALAGLLRSHAPAAEARHPSSQQQ